MKWWRRLRRGPVRAGVEVALGQALEGLECHFSLFDPERKLVFHNSSYAALHGQSWAKLPRPLRYDDLMRAAIVDANPAADVETELAGRLAAHERPGSQHFERLYPGNRWMRVSRYRLPDGHVAGLSLDINDLKAREAITTASEARYRALVDTASVGIWHLQADGQTLFANDRLATMFGGAAPWSMDAAGLRGPSSANEDPFGFPAGDETRAVLPARAGQAEISVLVAASHWVEADGAGPRTAVLTLIDVSALDAARARADHLAWHDALTGLPNRAAFQRALDAIEGTAEEAALLLIDLDEFKAVNDRHGHATGDILLRETAHRLREAVRPGDLPCRIGGDEFVVLLRGAAATSHAPDTAARLSRAFTRPVDADGTQLPLSASIGHAAYPRDATNTEALQRAADLALYDVKRRGRGGVTAYSRSLSDGLERRRTMKAALALAIRRDELCLVWQTQVHASGVALRGAEALLRWPGSPFGPNVSPGEFLSVADEAGLMPVIDNWVLETALEQMGEWIEQPGAPPLVAVNISAVTLRDPQFPARVAEALLRHRVAAALIEIEIPEDIAARDLDAVEPVLLGLQAIGVKLALDDFGGGLSSVAHLVRLPVDVVKLDRSVVMGLPAGKRERAVLRAVAGIARSLGIPLLAEGVETDAQAFFLRREGCELMQGYLYARPVPAAVLMPGRRQRQVGP